MCFCPRRPVVKIHNSPDAHTFFISHPGAPAITSAIAEKMFCNCRNLHDICTAPPVLPPCRQGVNVFTAFSHAEKYRPKQAHTSVKEWDTKPTHPPPPPPMRPRFQTADFLAYLEKRSCIFSFFLPPAGRERNHSNEYCRALYTG